MTANWKTVRVFISSTFRDMHAERDHLINAVFPELQERMAERRLHLRPVDLRWGVLREEDALDICLSVIEECRPFFICLLGGRYGFIPPGSEDSITAREIFHGVLDNPDQQMVSYFYFRDPEITAKIPQPLWPEYNESDPALQNKLEALKGRIRQTGFPERTYACRWDESQNKLTGLDDFGKQVLEDLWTAISRQYPAGREEEEAENPEQEAMDHFAENLLQHFAGRRGLLDRLHQFAANDASRELGNPGIICATGTPGCGKSTLLSKFCREYAQNRPEGTVIPHFTGATAASTQVQQMLSRFWMELDRIAGTREEPPQNLRDLITGFPVLLEKAGQAKPVCLVIDAINQLEDQDISWLPERLPDGVTVVLSALECEALDALRKRRWPPIELNVESLSGEEALGIVGNYLKQHLRKLAPGQIAALLSKSSTRNPLYLLVALEELRLSGRFETLEQQIESFPDDIPTLFESMLVRLEKEHGGELVRDFLGFIATGRGGQTEEDLRALLKPENEPKLPDLKWTRLFRSLQFYLLRRSEFIDLFHQQFRQAVEKRYLSGEAARDYHRKIASYLSERGTDYIISLKELPYHLSRAGMADALYDLIEDPGFRQQKLLATGSVFELCTDIGLALDAALAGDDLPRIAQFGFLNADYNEGRFGKADIPALYRHSLKPAIREARLLQAGPRFRMLVYLAVREAEAGHLSSADELILEAQTIKGLDIPESDGEFISQAVASLIKSGCHSAIGLLEKSFQPAVAVRLAVKAAGGLDKKAQHRVLSAAIEWLGRNFAERPEASKPVEVFEALARAVLRYEDPALRDQMIASLEEMIGWIRTILDTAQSDLERATAIALLQYQLGEGKDEPLLAGDIRLRMRATLGVVLFEHGLEPKGVELLEKAIDSARKEEPMSSTFGFLTKILRRLPWETAEPLFRKLLAAGRSKYEAGNLDNMLAALVDEKVRPGLPEMVKMIRSRIDALPAQKQVNPLKKAAILYEKMGRGSYARSTFSHLYLPSWLLPSLIRNPLIDTESKARLIIDTFGLSFVPGKRGSGWIDLRLKQTAGLIFRIANEKSRAELLKRFLGLSDRSGRLAGVLECISLAGSTDALELILESAQKFNNDQRTVIRNEILKAAARMDDEKSKLTLWTKWVETADQSEIPGVLVIRKWVEGIGDEGLRAKGHGMIAGALAEAGARDEALTEWHKAALAEQEAATQTMVFASRIAASATGQEKDQEWQQALGAVRCPDPAFARKSVEIFSNAGSGPLQLRALEKEILKVPGYWFQREDLLHMHLAAARAWGRLGKPGRGARFAWEGCRRFSKRSFSDGLLDGILETTPFLAGQPFWLRLTLRVISAFASNLSPNTKKVGKLAETLAAVPDERFARDVFGQAWLAVRESDNLYKWKIRNAVAGLAAGLAKRGQVRLAGKWMAWVSNSLKKSPQSSDEEETILPASQVSARAAISRAWKEIWLAEKTPSQLQEVRQTLSQTVTAAGEITDNMHRGESVAALIHAWEVARDLGLPESESIRLAAEKGARHLSEVSMYGDHWSGFAELARVRLDSGEPDLALETIKEVKTDSNREEFLVGLIGKAGFGTVPKFWKEIPTAEGRRKAAWEIAKLSYQAQSSPNRIPDRRQWKSPRRDVWGTILFTAAVVILPYWLIWQYGWSLFKNGLSGPYYWWWLIGLILAIVFIVAKVSKNIRDDVRNIFLRIGASLLFIPILPLALIPDIAGFYRKYRQELTHRLLWLGRTLGIGRKASNPVPETAKPDPETYKKLLRMASVESGSFDLLFSSFPVFFERKNPDALLSRLPALRVPNALPEALQNSKREYDEAMRYERFGARLSRNLRKAVFNAGFWVSNRFFYTPLMMYELLSRNRVMDKAQKLARLGDKYLNGGKPDQAAALFKRSLEIYPENPYAWNDYSIALQGLNRMDEAVAAQRQAVENSFGRPDEAKLWYGLGYILWMTRRYEEGVKAFEKVLELAAPGSQEYEEAKRGRQYCIDNMT